MGAQLTPSKERPPKTSEIEEQLRSEGLPLQRWGNGPHDKYEWHSHSYHKIVLCLRGSIVFHTKGGDFELQAGDRLEVEPGTEHAATVGSDGVECLEAHQS